MLDLLDFALSVTDFQTQTSLVRVLDFCWISRRVERIFAARGTSKTPADLVVRLVGGDGFEPPTPAL